MNAHLAQGGAPMQKAIAICMVSNPCDRWLTGGRPQWRMFFRPHAAQGLHGILQP